MNDSPLRIAVVGVGGIGGVHLGLIEDIGDYELTAICDLDPTFLEGALAKYPVKAFSDPMELFSSKAADAVVIGTPGSTHFKLASSAIEAGLHVYCEKPITLVYSEGHELHELATARGVCFQVGFQYRFQPVFATVKKMISEGAIGELFRANLYSTSWYRTQAYFESRPWRKQWDKAGGGVLMNQAIHNLDVFLWMTGMPARLTARAWRARHRAGVEDDALALVEFASGARGVIAASSIDAVGVDRMEFHGEEGSLIVEGTKVRHARLPSSIQKFTDENPEMWGAMKAEWEDVPIEDPGAMHSWTTSCHRDFIGAAAESRLAMNNAREASNAVEVANAIYLSAIKGESVTLPLDAAEYRSLFEKLCSGEVELAVRPGDD